MVPKVIVDIDVGSDDAFALLCLLAAEKLEQIEILAITCVNGNTTVQNVYTNVKKLLKIMDNENIPVFIGASTQLINLETDKKLYFHGKDGFGDLEYEIDGISPKDCPHNRTRMENKIFDRQNNICNIIDNENAVTILNKLVQKYPKEISLICLAPLTNIALAMRVYSTFSENVKDCFIMGGNIKGVGNTTSAAEFNFHSDPEAAFIVMHSNVQLHILPWEPCLDVKIPFEWRQNIIGVINNPVIKLLNAVEYRIYPEETKYWCPCDAFLVAAFLNSKIILKSELHNVSIELQGIRTRGQMVLDHMKIQIPNAHIITEIDTALFKQNLLSYLTHLIN